MVTSEWYVAVAPLRGCFLPDWAEHLVTVSVNKSSDINWFVCWDQGGRKGQSTEGENVINNPALLTSYTVRSVLIAVVVVVMFWDTASRPPASYPSSTHFPLTQSGRAWGVESVVWLLWSLQSPLQSVSWTDLIPLQQSTSQEDRDTVSLS